MSRLFPHAAYAEDQPYSYTILTTHCLHRGFTTGAVLTLPFAAYQHLRAPAPKPSFLTTYTLRAARGSLIGTGVLALGLVGRMWGREPIEWADRSWRLLANEGQVKVDDWSLAGIVVGATGALVAARTGRAPALLGRGWRVPVGGAAVGSAASVVGYLGWTYGLKREKKVEVLKSRDVVPV